MSPARLKTSVIAVPPLARDTDGRISASENRLMIEYLERGGISILLYGGNANLYHVRLSEYAALLELLSKHVAPATLVIPSIGPSYGLMLDQAEILRDFNFPTAMVLPQREIADSAGIACGIAQVAQKLGRPIVLYIKHGGWIQSGDVRRLFDDGLIAFVKYAVVREDPAVDPYLSEILQAVPADRVVSGMGEQPAIVHLRDFGLAGFTSGCVCVAPRLSLSMLTAIQRGDFARAEEIRQQFVGLEDVRNAISPIRVLHRAVALAGIAQTGPMWPLLSELDGFIQSTVEYECKTLLSRERGE